MIIARLTVTAVTHLSGTVFAEMLLAGAPGLGFAGGRFVSSAPRRVEASRHSPFLWGVFLLAVGYGAAWLLAGFVPRGH
ncbi:MAG: hypothetical protein ACP5QO_17495 [Clostridia bacterium]